MASSRDSTNRGKTSKPAKAKISREAKQAQRAAGRQRRRETFAQMRQAFTLTRQNDNRLIPYLALTFVLAFVVVFLICLFTLPTSWIGVIPGLIVAAVATMFVFSRRAQRSAYTQAEGRPGVVPEVLKQLRGDWHRADGVAATAQLDAVHRLLGRPGVVLVGEGAPHRLKPLLAQEKKRVARLAGDAPIYDVIVGSGEGEVPLAKLNMHLMRLPRNLSQEQVSALNRRLNALGAARAPLPQGPMPAGVKMRNVQRATRRRG